MDADLTPLVETLDRYQRDPNSRELSALLETRWSEFVDITALRELEASEIYDKIPLADGSFLTFSVYAEHWTLVTRDGRHFAY